jgi:hypothetical protein
MHIRYNLMVSGPYLKEPIDKDYRTHYIQSERGIGVSFSVPLAASPASPNVFLKLIKIDIVAPVR